LICYGVSIDSYDANSGIIKYSIAVANTGSTDDPPLGIGGIFLSTDQVVNNNDDIHLADIPASATPHTSQQLLQGSLQIPFTTKPGNYFLGAALDINNRVNELSDANNYAFSANTINVPQTISPTFDGTDKADTMIINQPTSNVITVTINGSAKVFPRDRILTMTFNGLGGDDQIRALPTLDVPLVINGGDGHDSLQGGGAGDTINGGKGRDTIQGNGGRDSIHGGADNDFLFGDSKGDRIWGDAGNDFLDGGGGDDRLDGGAGNDTIYGQGGNDIITAKDGQIDQVFGGSDTDRATLDLLDVRSSIETVV
jgi:Ca2+-binding RTX toxin-like protein